MRSEEEIKEKLVEQFQLAGMKVLNIDSLSDFLHSQLTLSHIDGYREALEWVLSEESNGNS